MSTQFFEAIFASCEGYIEIRLLPSAKQVFTTLDELSKALDRATKTGENTHFGVCPRSKKKGNEASVRQVPCLWVDLDAKDFEGGKNEAHTVLDEWPLPPSAIVDSGHGYHAYWLLGEPETVSTAAERLIVKGYVKGLANAMGGDHAYALPQVLRVPGTLNLKDPAHPKSVTLLQLHPRCRYDLTDFDKWRVDMQDTRSPSVELHGSVEVPKRFYALLKNDKQLKDTWEHRRTDLNDQSRSGYDMALAHLLVSRSFSDGEIAAVLRARPLGRGSEATENYLARTISKAGAHLDEKHTLPQKRKASSDCAAEHDEECKRWTLEDLSGMLPSMQWLWPGWIPTGYLCELVGEPEVGKSNLALAFTASVIRGDTWPDSAPCGGRGVIVWVDTEAAQALLCDRVRAWQLPADRLVLPWGPDPLADIHLDDPAHWKRIVLTVSREEPRLVVVDSLRGGHRLDENSSDTIGILHQLAALARDQETSVLVIHHLRKRGTLDGKELTLDRVRGSSAITQIARVILAVDVPDVTRKSWRRLYQIKNNVGLNPRPIGFEIRSSGLAFGEAPQLSRRSTQLEQAQDILLAMLAKGRRLVAEIEAAMKAAGISWRTAQDAKKQLGIDSRKQACKTGRWTWSLTTEHGDHPP